MLPDYSASVGDLDSSHSEFCVSHIPQKAISYQSLGRRGCFSWHSLLRVATLLVGLLGQQTIAQTKFTTFALVELEGDWHFEFPVYPWCVVLQHSGTVRGWTRVTPLNTALQIETNRVSPGHVVRNCGSTVLSKAPASYGFPQPYVGYDGLEKGGSVVLAVYDEIIFDSDWVLRGAGLSWTWLLAIRSGASVTLLTPNMVIGQRTFTVRAGAEAWLYPSRRAIITNVTNLTFP